MSIEQNEPSWCPFCKSDNIVVCQERWFATSTERHGEGGQFLSNRCEACGSEFFVVDQEDVARQDDLGPPLCPRHWKPHKECGCSS